MKNKLNWYSVKTLFKIENQGKPKVSDKYYVKNAFMYEERVVLFKAKSFESAVKQAELEAEEYCKYKFTNIYGQKVITKSVGVCEAFDLFDAPGAGVEVYSSNIVTDKRIDNKNLINMRFGINAKPEMKLRRKFLSEEFNKISSPAKPKKLKTNK